MAGGSTLLTPERETRMRVEQIAGKRWDRPGTWREGLEKDGIWAGGQGVQLLAGDHALRTTESRTGSEAAGAWGDGVPLHMSPSSGCTPLRLPGQFCP